MINIITKAQQQIKSQIKQLHVILIIRRALHIQQWVKIQIKQSTCYSYNKKGYYTYYSGQKSDIESTCTTHKSEIR
jgi:hypothetical protein